MLRNLLIIIFFLMPVNVIIGQELDSTLAIFFNEDFGKTPIVKKQGDPLTIIIGENLSISTTNLVILSDSSISMNGEIVLLSDITAVRSSKKGRAVAGSAVIAAGTLGAVAGVALIISLNKAIEENLIYLIVALPMYVVAAGMLTGGAVVSTVGLITILSGAPRNIKVKSTPVVKYFFENS